MTKRTPLEEGEHLRKQDELKGPFTEALKKAEEENKAKEGNATPSPQR